VISPKLTEVIPREGLVLTAGGIRSGKSCLVYGILEHCHDEDPERKIYAYNYPKEKAEFLPDWIEAIDTEDFPEGSVVIADEAYLSFYSKDHGSDINKYMDVFAGLAAQKGILILFITQTTRKLSLAQVSGVQVVLLKRPDVMMTKLDRSELRKIMTAALEGFRALEPDQRQAAVYVVSFDFEGIITEANTPPEFWTEELSRAWQGVSLLEGAKPSEGNWHGTPYDKLTCCEDECPQPAAGVCDCCACSWCAEHLGNHEPVPVG